MRYRVPQISHVIAVIMLDLAFYTKTSDGVGDAVNIFIFLYLLTSAIFIWALLAQKWDTILGEGALTS